MSVFVPFRALRPVSEFAEQVASKPYDVLNTEEARQESKDNPHSYYHVIKPEIDFPADHDPFDPAVYAQGRKNLMDLISGGILKQDERDAFYVYRLRMGDHEQTGLVGCCSIDDYFNGVIKKHESTKPKIERDRMKHITESKMNYEAVFLSYPQQEEIDNVVRNVTQTPPVYSFTSDDGISHTLWVLNEADQVKRITELFASQVPAIYIADGHHRTAAGALAGKHLREHNTNGVPNRFDYFMAALFPDNEVQVLEYNRLVKDLNGHSTGEFLKMLEQSFDVKKTDECIKPVSNRQISMFLDGGWYLLEIHDDLYDRNDVIARLSFTTLSKYVLEPILNIKDLRRDNRIEFVGGIRGPKELERRVNNGDMEVGFLMYPISMEEIIMIADQDLEMPPKITWFEPKLRSGLFVHSLNGLEIS